MMYAEQTQVTCVSKPLFQPKWLMPVSLKTVLFMVFALNVFDTFATLTWVIKRIAYEANPLMASLLYNAPALFIVLKLSLAGLGCLLLWRLRRRELVTVVSQMLLVVYALLGIYHLQGFALIF